MNKPIAKIDIPLNQWEKTGSDDDRSSRLLAHMEINGLNLHVEAIAVHIDKRNFLVADDPMFWDDVDRYQDIQDSCFSTVRIGKRQYIIVATPFGD